MERNKPFGIDWSIFFLGLIGLFPFLKISFNTYLIVLWIIMAAILNWKKAPANFRLNKRVLAISILPFLIISIALTHSKNLGHGVEKTIQALPLLIFPLGIFLFYDNFQRRQLNFLINFFAITCIAHSFYLGYHFFSSKLLDNFNEITFSYNPFRETVYEIQWGDLHPTYVSLWYVFTISFLVCKLRKVQMTWQKGLLVIAISHLILVILLLSSRIGFMGLAIVFLIHIFFIKKKKLRNTLFFLIMGAFISALLFMPMLSSRFLQEFKVTELSPPEGKMHNSVNIRIGTYICAKQIIKENIFLGVGIGDVQNELDRCYGQFNTEAYQLKNYNSHSYYLNVLLFAGVFGFILFYLPFAFFIFISIRNRDLLYISFLTLIFGFMITENILSRNHGVLFFALFNTVFLNYHKTYANSFIGHISQFGRKIKKDFK